MTIEILLIEMLKRISIAAVLGLLLSQTRLFDRIMSHRLRRVDQVLFIVFFSIVAIAGTYAGIPVDDAIANSRMIGIMAAGLLGGPLMGSTVGFIAGLHRFTLGGFTGLACAISSLTEGLLAGIFSRLYPRTPIHWSIALIAGLIGEILQMCIILTVAEPFTAALNLLSHIAIPMIVANSLGLALFVIIIEDAFNRRETILANQSNTVLLIARRTVPYLRKGLNFDTATQVVKIIKDLTLYDAVSITNTEEVLAFIGNEHEHHGVGKTHEFTKLTITSLKDGQIHVATNPSEIGCTHPGCKLYSAVIVPLHQGDEIVGTLKMYYTENRQQVNHADLAFARGLADLFSTQLELNEIDLLAKRTEEAKLRSLYAQINPHFLFNTLNTISSLIRTNPELARKLLIKFAHLFRFTLQYTGKIIPLKNEWIHAKAFLDIAEARQGDKLKVITEVDEQLMAYGIPSLTLQPLIENAIKHGLQVKDEGGTLKIVAKSINEVDWEIQIIDDGVGFKKDPEILLNLQNDGEHIGLINVHERLKGTYGKRYGLTIKSETNKGTTVSILLPKEVCQ